jgi:hypothetical protein
MTKAQELSRMSSIPSLSVVVPTLGRPHRISKLTINLLDNTPDADWEVIWVIDTDDFESQKAVAELRRAGCGTRLCSGTFPHKMNVGVADATKDLILPGGDDMYFRKGWYEKVLKEFQDPAIQVVGTNELTAKTKSGDHSNFPVVRRSYIEDPGSSWGQKGLLFFEGYHHNFVETEVISLARARGAWKFAHDSIIEHHHPNWGTRERDETDRRGGQNRFYEDERIFNARSLNWAKGPVA